MKTVKVKWEKGVGCLIMGVDEGGQSVLEFLVALPLLIGMTLLLIRINTAIQISIVDQQYARAQTLALALNSPFYPANNHKMGDLVGKKANQLLVGISDNPAGNGDYVPKATVQMITRNKNKVGINTDQEEPSSRGLVRIRNTVTLCAPTYFIGAGQAILNLSPPSYVAAGTVILNELNGKSQFASICGSSLKYEQ